MTCDHKIYGMVTVNAKGQIVIPADARTHMNIASWDQFIVVSHGDNMLGLIKADNLQEFIIATQQQHPEMFEQLEKLNTYVR